MSSWLSGKYPFRESILSRFRTSLPVKDEVDVSVYLESFQAHWHQAWARMQSHQDGATVTTDEVNCVLNHTDQLMALLCWELQQQQQQQASQSTLQQPGCLSDLFLASRVPERLLSWSDHCGAFEPVLHTELLRVFEQLLGAGGGALLEQRAVLRPLTDLLLRCRRSSAAELHRRLVDVLSQLCLVLHAQPALLDLFLGLQPDGSASSFVIFALLVEFVHRDGVVGGSAREALLLCMRLSAGSEQLARYIVQHSDFCVVLATGLSGLYSALPRTPPGDDEQLPEVDAFIGSLEFCNSVLQTCHPLIAAQLLELVYQGFLVSVMGPALHQNSVEAIVTATTYLELCVRSVDHPGLVRALLRLLLRHRHDGVTILDTLVQRIAATPRLSVATLSLLHTLLNLNCEDVMLELVLRHLLPCTHLMASQRARVTETDLYGAGARRLLALVPACCQPTTVAAAAWRQCGREARDALAACRRATRGWTYAYDGGHPSPAEVERMARRRRQTGGPSPTTAEMSAAGGQPRSEERGEADGAVGCEDAGPAAVGGSPGWGGPSVAGSSAEEALSGDGPADRGDEPGAAGRPVSPQPGTDGTPGPEPGTPPPGQRAAEPAPDVEDSDPPSPSGRPPPSVSPVAGQLEGGDADTSSASQLWATPSAAPPAAGPELDLSVNDDWATPHSFAGHSGRGSEAELDVDSLKLGILSLLPDELSSEAETPSKVGEPWSLRSGPPSGEEEPVRRHSQPSIVPGAASSAGDGPSGDDGPAAAATAAGTSRPSAVPAEPPVSDRPSEDGDGPGTVTSGAVSDTDRAGAASDTDKPAAVSDSPPAGYDGRSAVAGELSPVAAGGEEPAADMSPAVSGAAAAVSSDLSSFVERHRGTVRAPPPAPSLARPPLSSLHGAASDTAGGVPNIGPFLLALLERLDLATTNSLQLNLLLMSVISRLSHYPQPLLRSLLLNPTLVFQPSVRSLIQTLGSLKHRIDLATRSVQDAPGLVRWARARLEARRPPADPAPAPGPAAAGTALGTAPASLPAQPTPSAAAADADSGGFSLTGWAGRLRRALPAVSLTMESSDQPRRRPSDTRWAAVPPVGAGQPEWDGAERRLALTAVLLEQWLMELAAVALEHSVATEHLVFTV